MSDAKDSAAFRTELDSFMTGLVRRNPGEPEFHQAVREVAESVKKKIFYFWSRSLRACLDSCRAL